MLLGPKGKSGRVTLPLNVFVTDAKREKLVTDKVKVDVDIALDKPIGYFSIVRTVTFPFPEGSRPGRVRGVRRLRPRHAGRWLTPYSAFRSQLNSPRAALTLPV